ncbi:hypothetical protein [Nannocystis punicea]|uniref:Uncharacterized protein n=1 Tax=Nannocystis punicea TaxID=2995304 RepID=A0ABY7H9G8_9BACT|nr:hypothetical protein [Nannocystis poenicansa]WAS95902.1 hypothetical protein O0S08_07035 [Nannocystis poenicansa]
MSSAPTPPLLAYKLVAILTTFIAGVSLLVAVMLMLRVGKTRDLLQSKLQACPCCHEALAAPPTGAPPPQPVNMPVNQPVNQPVNAPKT